MRNFLAFDIEIAKIMPDNPADFKRYRPLGISCAAALDGEGNLTLFHGRDAAGQPTPQMTREEVGAMVGFLSGAFERGFTIATWNGLGFDFDILAEESGDFETCRELALGHVDMMFHLFCEKGYPLSLESAAHGMALSGKPPGMDGALAPKLWAAGQHQQVLDYVAQDVRTTLDLVVKCENQRALGWTSRRGRPQSLPLPKGWLSVEEAMRLPEPDNSWMSNPWPRGKFTGWLEKA